MYLVNIKGNSQKVVEINKPKITVGRSIQCDLYIPSSKVSRIHCIITKKQERYYIEDFGSRNGTFVNSVKIEKRTELKPDDKVQFGDSIYILTDKYEEEIPGVTQEISIYDRETGMILDSLIAISGEDRILNICSIIVDLFIRLSDAKRGSILLSYQDGTTPLVCKDNQGNDIGSEMDFCRSILEEVFSDGKELYIDDPDSETDFSSTLVQHKLVSVYAAPFTYNEKVIGAIYLDSDNPLKKLNSSRRNLLTLAQRYFSMLLYEKLEKDEFLHELRQKNTDLELEISSLRSLSQDKIVGESDVIYEMLQKIRKVADTDVSVLITGESGTGKELIARFIHVHSKRSGKPFVVIDCSSIPESLIESELFGYEKGSFTGATDTKKGRIEVADKGTVFFDEISELPLEQQKRLLRFLQEMEILRIGSTKPIKVDVRVVAATNKDLKDLVGKGCFREDLFYRLNVVNITVPSLKERKDDIPLLVDYFIKIFNKKYNKNVKGITGKVLDSLKRRQFRGNVRELKHLIEQSVILCEGTEINEELLNEGVTEQFETLQTAREKFEKDYIVNVLLSNGFNVTKSAKLLGISRQHLQNFIKKFNIKRP